MSPELPVFRTNKVDTIRISWQGNEDCFTKNQKIILNSLGNGLLQWKRDSQTSNFPLNLRFQPFFVHFDPECSIIKTGISTGSSDHIPSEFAFLHIYFIYAKNFEEYRISVRPEISEWFSDLTEANCLSWIIIFDSSRVKDKKNRTQINDKLKNDFARFQNRIFESNEISSEKAKASLTLLLQNNLFSSFDNYSNNITNKLRKLKEVVNEDSFLLSNLINEQFRLSLFYWSLGLFELALSELDALTSFFSDSIRALAQKNDFALNSINWLKQLRPLPLDKCCILLNQQFNNTWSDDWTLVRVHAHLLSHKIMLATSLLNYRLILANTPPSSQHKQQQEHNQLPQTTNSQVLYVKTLSEINPPSSFTTTTTNDSSLIPSSSSMHSISQNSSSIETSTTTTTFSQLNTLQLRHDCILTILNYARETFQHLEEDLHILCANFNSAHLNFLFIFWQEEIIKFIEHLLFSVDYEVENKDSVYDELVMMESSSASHGAFLLHKKCEALYNLYLLFTNANKSQEITIARRWLQQTSLTSANEDNNYFIPETFRIFNAFFCNSSTELEKIGIYVKNELNDALIIFKKHNWMGHVLYLERCISSLSENSKQDLYNSEKENLKKLLSGDSLFYVQDIKGYLKNFVDNYIDQASQTDNDLLFNCLLVLLTMVKNDSSDSDEAEDFLSKLSNISNTEKTISNKYWLLFNSNNIFSSSSNRPIVQFPFKIVRICSPPLFRSTLFQPAQLILDIYNYFPIKFYNCKIKVLFKLFDNQFIPLAKTFAFQQKLQIEDSTEETIYSLDCVTLDCLKEDKFDKNKEEDFNENNIILVDGNLDLIVPGVNKCIFRINENKRVGCFQLFSIQISIINPKCTFILDFGRELERNSLLEHIFMLVDKVEPSICVKDQTVVDGNKNYLELTAGMKQKISLEFNSGTNEYLNDTFCLISLVGVENKNLKFLNSDNKWISGTVQHRILPIKPNESHCICLDICMAIDKIMPISTNSNNSTNEEFIKCEVKLDWQITSPSKTIFTKFLQLKFLPLFNLHCTTSLLAGNAIFILDIERRFVKKSLLYKAVTILPLEITLHQEQNIALEPIEAKLLNPYPLMPIVANSSFRFIWRLPESQAGRNFHVPHFFKFVYNISYEQEIIQNNINEENDKILKSDKYLIEKKLEFVIPKVDFEICARFYSEHSQSVLCRVDQPCDFIVSLRSLAKLIEAENVIVSIDIENNNNNGYWYCQQKHKLTKVKDNGIGQVIFSIVPKMLGHLPYPSISLNKYIPYENSSKQQLSSSLTEKRFGDCLSTFYLNKGNQIHILAHLNASEENTSLASTNTSESEQKKKSLKSQAKDRLSRLFE